MKREDCYTMAEAEEVTGYSRSTIYKLLLDGKLSRYSEAGRQGLVLFLKTDIDKLKKVEKNKYRLIERTITEKRVK